MFSQDWFRIPFVFLQGMHNAQGRLNSRLGEKEHCNLWEPVANKIGYLADEYL